MKEKSYFEVLAEAEGRSYDKLETQRSVRTLNLGWQTLTGLSVVAPQKSIRRAGAGISTIKIKESPFFTRFYILGNPIYVSKRST